MSPLPTKIEVKEEVEEAVVEMDFPQAIRKITKGEKVTKLDWKDKKVYGYINDGFLTLHKGGKDYSWTISYGDLLGKDFALISNL